MKAPTLSAASVLANPAPVCRTCGGCGLIGVESRTSFAVDSAECPDCEGTGERESDVTTRPELCDHAALKQPALWSKLPKLGRQQVEASDEGPAYALDMANCPWCHSTLCVEVAL